MYVFIISCSCKPTKTEEYIPFVRYLWKWALRVDRNWLRSVCCAECWIVRVLVWIWMHVFVWIWMHVFVWIWTHVFVWILICLALDFEVVESVVRFMGCLQEFK